MNRGGASEFSLTKMARPARSEPVDFSKSANLSMGLIDRAVCPPGKFQVFLRDQMAPGLRVRVMPTGSKTFVLERKVGQKTVRRALGDVRLLTLEQARDEARRLYVLVGQGGDVSTPASVQPAGASTTVALAWTTYLADRKDAWGDRWTYCVCTTRELKRGCWRRPACLIAKSTLVNLSKCYMIQ